MNLSLPASLSETEREEQRNNSAFCSPLRVGEGLGERSNKACRTHVSFISMNSYIEENHV